MFTYLSSVLVRTQEIEEWRSLKADCFENGCLFLYKWLHICRKELVFKALSRQKKRQANRFFLTSIKYYNTCFLDIMRPYNSMWGYHWKQRKWWAVTSPWPFPWSMQINKQVNNRKILQIRLDPYKYTGGCLTLYDKPPQDRCFIGFSLDLQTADWWF